MLAGGGGGGSGSAFFFFLARWLLAQQLVWCFVRFVRSGAVWVSWFGRNPIDFDRWRATDDAQCTTARAKRMTKMNSRRKRTIVNFLPVSAHVKCFTVFTVHTHSGRPSKISRFQASLLAGTFRGSLGHTKKKPPSNDQTITIRTPTLDNNYWDKVSLLSKQSNTTPSHESSKQLWILSLKF